MKIISGILVALLFIISTFLLGGYSDTFVIYTYGAFLFATSIPFFSFISSKQYKWAVIVFTLSLVSFLFLLACLMSQPMPIQ